MANENDYSMMIKSLITPIFTYSSVFTKNNMRPFLIDVVPPSD
jgi:hypothetical protein